MQEKAPLKMLLMRPGKLDYLTETVFPVRPTYEELSRLLQPLLGGKPERVAVLADFSGGKKYQPLDMFVYEHSLLKRLPRNENATTIYRRATLLRAPSTPPESLSYIAGPAVLMDRRVWF